MWKRLLVVTLSVLLLAGFILQSGCTSEQSKPSPKASKASAEQNKETAVFIYDRAAITGPKPWTSENFRNNPDNFQFAVVGDRTGGSDPGGIFNRAMEQLDLLQPEFVINVGDLVEGYAKDAAKANAQWDEAEGMIKKLEMPFFYTVGNHDLGNDTMKQVWLKRHGPLYYYFIYHNVLFLVFNSEDPSNPVPKGMEERTAQYKKLQKEDPAAAKKFLAEFMAEAESYKKPMNMSDQQLNYFRRVLADHPEVRWTFAFMHQPDWEHKNPGRAFQAIEQMLQGRPHTVIAGHLHYYDYQKRNGVDYITMGPVGASWHKNGPGNVDDILWVTMKQGGPEIAMITLDGIWDRKGRDLKIKEKYERTVKSEGVYSEP
jgi:predicted phosphodiesterase